MPHLAGCDQVLDRAGDVLDRHLWVDAVLVVQIDAVGPQPAERVPTARRMLLGPAVTGHRRARHRSLRRSKPNLVAIFTWSRTGSRASPTISSFVERPVHFGGVEEGHAEFDRTADQGDRVLAFRSAGVAVGTGQAHAAQTDFGDVEPGAEGSLVHGDMSFHRLSRGFRRHQ